MDQCPSPNHDARKDGGIIDMVVLHYTGMVDCQAALDRLCDPAAKVSAHYLIDESGRVTSLVAEERRAWHAGQAFWRGHTDINGRSIGIELVNPGHEFGLTPFPDDQMAALIDLCGEILSRHRVPPVNIVGHCDIAPRRKQDPGELFAWQRLAQAGFGLWPDIPNAAQRPVPEMLAAIGYETLDLEKTIQAFQRHYRPNLIDGLPDEETVGLIAAVVDLASDPVV